MVAFIVIDVVCLSEIYGLNANQRNLHISHQFLRLVPSNLGNTWQQRVALAIEARLPSLCNDTATKVFTVKGNICTGLHLDSLFCIVSLGSLSDPRVGS
jgi:hypothetical protein